MSISDLSNEVVQKINFGLALRIVLVIGVPIFLWWFLFRPFETIQLRPNVLHIIITPAQTEKNFVRSVIAQTIETSLSLGYYRVCILNRGLIFINGNPITRDQIEKANTEIGIAKIDVSDGNGSTTLAIKPQETKCVRLYSADENIDIEFSPVGARVKDDGFEFFEKNFKPNDDLSKSAYELSLNFDNVEILYKNDIASILLAKLLIIFIFINSFILLLAGIYNFCFKSKKNSVC